MKKRVLVLLFIATILSQFYIVSAFAPIEQQINKDNVYRNNFPDVDDGIVDISDAVALLNYLFLGGEKPPAPFDEEGEDLTPDNLECELLPV